MKYRFVGLLRTSPTALEFTLVLQALDTGIRLPIRVLIDSGASGTFISQKFVKKFHLTFKRLDNLIPVRNADGTLSRGGPISSCCDIFLFAPKSSHQEHLSLEVTSLGEYNVIPGFPWLHQHNPKADWRKGTIDLFGDTNSSSTGHGVPKHVEDDQTDALEELIACLGLSSVPKPFDSLRDPSPPHFLRGISVGDHSRTTTAEEDMKAFIPEKYWDFKDVFLKAGFDQLPPHSDYDHAIHLQPDFKPQRGKIYALSPREQKELDKFLDENLSTGRIRPSKSSHAAAFFFAPKVEEVNAPGIDPGLRPIQDYRYLNVHTIHDRYPLPLLSKILQQPKFQMAKYFTVIDIRWGYNNIWIKEGDKWKAAFITNCGLFEPLVMFFGLCNAPASFQRMINIRFSEVLASGCVFIYMDDIIILGDTQEEIEHWTCKVLQTMRDNGLSAKPVKCQFEKTIVKYLGHMIGQGQLFVNPSKIKAITDWPVPCKLRNVQSFLGTMNFWQKFIQCFSHTARPLHDLLRKDTAFSWTPAHQAAFDELKEAITSEPVLRTPQRNLPFVLETDSSGFAISGILMQYYNSKLHPIGFYSSTLNPAERNYPTPDQELLMIIKLLLHWRHLLEGAEHQIVIRSDNQALSYFMINHNLSCHQA